MSPPTPTTTSASRPTRGLLLVAGFVCVGLGGVGIVVPGLPTTVFFILAAACFSRSSPRFEAWILGLPRIGPLVRDHRDGLGMPRRAKRFAIASIVVTCGLSATLLIDPVAVRLVVVAVGAAGVAYVALRVPTRERVLATRDAGPPPPASGGGLPTSPRP